jgi:lysozyme
MLLLFSALAVGSAAYVGREGWETTAYPDPVHGAKVPTYCAGVTGGGVKVGDKFTEEECLRRTMIARVEHIVPILPCVRDDIPVTPRTADYLGVMANMSANVGNGREKPPSGFLGSTMCREMKAGNYRKACDGILLWWRAGGLDCRTDRRCRGLWLDRQKAHAACLQASPS